MQDIHGEKKTTALIRKIVTKLLKAGMIPQSYTYPKRMRSTRNLMRRLFFTRKRAEILAHIETTHHLYNLPSAERCVTRKHKRSKAAKRFNDICVQQSIEPDLTMLNHYDRPDGYG